MVDETNNTKFPKSREREAITFRNLNLIDMTKDKSFYTYHTQDWKQES